MESIYRWSLLYWWSVTGHFFLFVFFFFLLVALRAADAPLFMRKPEKLLDNERSLCISVFVKDKFYTCKLQPQSAHSLYCGKMPRHVTQSQTKSGDLRINKKND